MLHISGLTAEFDGTPILRGIDLAVNAGETHVILGPNGSGKSTLGRVILGDERYQKTAGTIQFSSENFDKLEPFERARAGFFLSFQSPPELDGVSVKEFLFAAKKAMKPDFASSFKFKKGLTETLESVHLSAEFSERETNKGASGGERRKLEMVSMLTLDPKLAFLDEIDSGTDVDARKAIGNAIRSFREDRSKAVVLITHTDKFLEEVPPTHVHVLVKGKIVKSGDPDLVSYVHTHGFAEFLPQKKVLGNLKMIS